MRERAPLPRGRSRMRVAPIVSTDGLPRVSATSINPVAAAAASSSRDPTAASAKTYDALASGSASVPAEVANGLPRRTCRAGPRPVVHHQESPPRRMGPPRGHCSKPPAPPRCSEGRPQPARAANTSTPTRTEMPAWDGRSRVRVRSAPPPRRSARRFRAISRRGMPHVAMAAAESRSPLSAAQRKPARRLAISRRTIRTPPVSRAVP